MKKNIFIIFLILLFGCKDNKEYIELTTGESQNPAQPRLRVLINSQNKLYISKEIILDKRRTSKYECFISNDKINFEYFVNLILKNFKNKVKSKAITVHDGTLYQISYKINNNEYASKFYEFDLSNEQQVAFNKIYELVYVNNLHKIKCEIPRSSKSPDFAQINKAKR